MHAEHHVVVADARGRSRTDGNAGPSWVTANPSAVRFSTMILWAATQSVQSPGTANLNAIGLPSLSSRLPSLPLL